MSIWFVIEHLSLKNQSIHFVPFILRIILFQQMIQPNMVMFVEECFIFRTGLQLSAFLLKIILIKELTGSLILILIAEP
jgi:hypothetical protein